MAGIEVVGAGGVGQGLGGLPRVGLERVEDELLGLQHRRRGHRRPVRDDVAARQKPVGGGPHEIPAVEGVEDEDRAGLLQEVAPGRPRVTAAGFLGQAVPQRRLQPARVVLGHSHLAGDLVDPLETVSGDVLDDAVRVLPEDADDALAERLQQHRGLVMRQAEAGQVRADLVFGGMGNPRVAQGRDRGYGNLQPFVELAGRLADEAVERLEPPGEVHDPFGRLRADALEGGVGGQV